MPAKPRLILHIGMHKTGSSSLQRFFACNRWLLGFAGIDYPRAYGADGRSLPKHNDLFLAISHEKDKQEPHPVFGPSTKGIARIADALNPGRVTVLSAEGFSGENPAFAQAFAPLSEIADVRVVCFLRRQDDWVVSFYKQMVLSREVRMKKTFEEFLALKSTRKHLDYASMLGWWSNAFGSANIRVLTYPPRRTVLADLLDAAELPAWLNYLPYGRCWENRGHPSGYIERVRLANLAGEEKPAPSVQDREDEILLPHARNELLASCAEGNEWIRAKFRPDMDRLFSA